MSERPAGMPLPRKESAAAAAVAAQPAFLLCPLFGDSPKPIPVGREHVLPQEAKPAEGAAGGAAPAEAVLGLRPQCGFAGDQAPHGANVARWHITLRAVPAPGPGAGAAGAVGAAGATQQWQLEAGVHQAAYLQWAGREPVHPVGAGITLLLQPHDRLFLAKQEDAEHYLFGFKVALPGASPLGAPRKRSSQAADGASQPPAKRAARHGWQAGAAAASLGGSRTAADGSSGVQAAEVPEFTPVRDNRHGQEGLREFAPNPTDHGGRTGRYTDDTQMTIALAKSLVRRGRCDPEDCTQAYVEQRRLVPVGHTYGRDAKNAFNALERGTADCRTSGRLARPDGSWGNGSVMRIAPVGLAYRNAPADVLRWAVADAVMCTHVHPEAADAAIVQAAAVGLLAKPGVTEPVLESPLALIARLLPLAATAAMRQRLEAIERALARLPAGLDTGSERGRVVSEKMRNGGYWQIRAVDATASVLWAFCRHWGHPPAAIVGAMHQGGDTDTLASMAGALAGAQHSCWWVPLCWWSALDRSVATASGPEALAELAVSLAALDVRE
ncbi:hypothetical protein CHLNCDRAFT_137020 [Chlorella variabilis]|uniref:ADP-ribosylhydrolase ARH3 n=1 Tax=Chlorella variabilis TaxID=554065 RepID=E1ZLT7_CHLVA|nr:hypothetical protein CHLNCDRAFT_137020 [Chlorella variabilis]EFN53193.1 hypothetical protein CHLNCDRAFT_137020 [Chlorella variabilis]|eukprot:XP_005845295.1 hypothetical protein CHLNCDRAFT_137020 [Chlorella variabilis]